MGLFSGIGKIVSSVAGIAGAVTGNPYLTAGSSILGGLMQNEQNKDAAERQMAFQQYNSNSAFQRARADAEAAGYNPMLGYFNPASTPSGASYTSQDAITPALNSARAVEDTKSTVNQRTIQNENIKANTLNTTANTVTAQTQAQLNSALKTKALADAGAANAQTANTNLSTILNTTNFPKQSREANMYKSDFGKAVPYIKPISEGANSAGNLLRSILPSKLSKSIDVRHHDY